MKHMHIEQVPLTYTFGENCVKIAIKTMLLGQGYTFEVLTYLPEQ